MVVAEAEARRERPSAISALEASLAGVVIMSLFAYLVAPALRLPAVDLTLLSGAGLPAPGGTDFLLAMLKLWPVGVAAGFLYAYGVAPVFQASGWLQGLLYGLALFFVVSLVAMPLAGWLHPTVAGGQVPHPGWLGLGLGGWAVPAVLLVDHLIFGIVLGSIYRPGPRAAEAAEG